MIAIGVVDTMGLVNTVEALDVCLKTAEVHLASYEKVGGGIVSFTVTGDVAAVTSAVAAGVAAAKRMGGYLHHTIIARIANQTNELFEEPRVLPVKASSPNAQQLPVPEEEAEAASTSTLEQVQALPKPDREKPKSTTKNSRKKKPNKKS